MATYEITGTADSFGLDTTGGSNDFKDLVFAIPDVDPASISSATWRHGHVRTVTQANGVATQVYMETLVNASNVLLYTYGPTGLPTAYDTPYTAALADSNNMSGTQLTGLKAAVNSNMTARVTLFTQFSVYGKHTLTNCTVHLRFDATPTAGTGGEGETAPPDRGVCADTFHDMLAVAWVNSSKQLKFAWHGNPCARIGDSANGWNATVTLESANARYPGLCYLPNGRLYVNYQLSGVGKYRTNDILGTGLAADWSSANSENANITGFCSSGRGMDQAYYFHGIGGSVLFAQCRDNQGVWNTYSGIASSIRGSRAGGVYLGNGFGLLYAQSGGNIYWLTTSNPESWSGAGTNTGLTGRVVALVRTPALTLVGLSYDATTRNCRAMRSRDRGATWERDGADIAAIPSLDIPPTLTCIGHYIFAVWVDTGTDTPRFACSVDQGSTWV